MNDNSFGFTYNQNSEYGNWCFNRSYPEGTPWNEVLRDYLTFLSSVYGYDISEKVEIIDNVY
jgi:hypothetical protein